MRDIASIVHRKLFGTHNGGLAREYQVAARDLADESRLFRVELFNFRQHNKDPLTELLRIRSVT